MLHSYAVIYSFRSSFSVSVSYNFLFSCVTLITNSHVFPNEFSHDLHDKKVLFMHLFNVPGLMMYYPGLYFLAELLSDIPEPEKFISELLASLHK